MVIKKEDLEGREETPALRHGGGTMRVRMKHQISGTRDGQPWPAPGEEVDLPEDEAVSLLRGGMAEAVEADGEPEPEETSEGGDPDDVPVEPEPEEATAPEPEKAVESQPEKATAPKATARTRAKKS